MWTLPDHPVIRNLERTGYPDDEEPTFPLCPVCGEESEDIYIDKYHEIVGCDSCVTKHDAWALLID